MSIELKIKANTLAAEARIIRRIELKRKQRFNKQTAEVKEKWGEEHSAALSSLHNHRTVLVRRAARATHLARAYLNGRAYIELETKAYVEPPYQEVAKMVKSYGDVGLFGNVGPDAIADWTRGHLDETELAELKARAKRGSVKVWSTQPTKPKVKKPRRAHRTVEEWKAMQADMEKVKRE